MFCGALHLWRAAPTLPLPLPLLPQRSSYHPRRRSGAGADVLLTLALTHSLAFTYLFIYLFIFAAKQFTFYLIRMLQEFVGFCTFSCIQTGNWTYSSSSVDSLPANAHTCSCRSLTCHSFITLPVSVLCISIFSLQVFLLSLSIFGYLFVFQTNVTGLEIERGLIDCYTFKKWNAFFHI